MGKAGRAGEAGEAGEARGAGEAGGAGEAEEAGRESYIFECNVLFSLRFFSLDLSALKTLATCKHVKEIYTNTSELAPICESSK